ncbi:von Willebrand factor type A domain protein [delta proteobacterium NaphS2]|nr:von Willebrand factor type A domain protein [delta proteobacterium NaphS2]
MGSGLFSQEGSPIPLAGVRVTGSIAGQGARITVSQRFRNEEKHAVEAVYKFPLPEGAAVCGFSVEKEGTRISGQVEERDKAFEFYDDALQEGKGGYLLDEERPNIFTLSAGNLNAGTEAVINIEYVTLIDGDEHTLRFLLPTTITPRYIPDHQAEDEDIPLDHRIHPPYARSVPYGMEMHLTLAAADKFSAIESPSHPIRIEQLSGRQTVISFSQESVLMDRDFILTLTFSEPGVSQVFLCRNNGATYVQMDFYMEHEEQNKSGNEDLLFVVDCSGSMQGDSIYEARQALDVCLKALEEGRRFNIIRFGSRFESLFSEPRAYSEKTLERALSWSRNMQADLGGTEILQPLQHIYKVQGDSDSRYGSILLLTDGAVGNEDDIFYLVRNRSGPRVFPVGIGAGCNEAFIKGLARAGKGDSAFIYPGERLGPKILSLFGRMSEHGIEPAINWGHKQADQTPADPVIYTRTRTSLFARFEGEHSPANEIEVTADVQGHTRKWAVPVLTVKEDHPGIPLLWAREKIRELEDAETCPEQKGSRQEDRKRVALSREITALSKNFCVLSRHTSFVAVEEREEKDLTTGEVRLRKIPVPVTMGWHGLPGLRQEQIDHTPMEGTMRFSIVTESESRYLGRPSINAPTFLRMASAEPPSPFDSDYSLVMAILGQQKAKGGFSEDKTLAEELGLDLQQIVSGSREIMPYSENESLSLLWSAVLLHVLEHRFPTHRKSWEKTVKKTRKWVEKKIRKQKPTIHGEPLMSWAARYVATRRLPD